MSSSSSDKRALDGATFSLPAPMLAGLFDLVERVSQELSLSDLYETLLDVMRDPQVFGAAQVVILEGDEQSDVLFAVAQSSKVFEGKTWHRSERFDRVLKGQIVALKDVEGAPEWHGTLMGFDEPLHAVLHMPLRHTTMLVAFHEEQGHFTREHVVAAGRFVPILSQLVRHNATHQQQLQRLRIESERRVMREQFLLIKHAARSLGAGVAVLDTQGGLREASEALDELVRAWGGAQKWWRSARRVLSETPITGTEAVGEEHEPEETRHIAKRSLDMDDPHGVRRVFELTFTGTPHRFEDGELGHVLLVADVTRWIMAEDALIDARDESERANRAKSRFLANMSHELRTPLNAIIGYSELLLEEAEQVAGGVFQEDLNKIHLSGKQLLSLINDVLDLSKIEAGKLDLQLSSFSIDALLDEVEATMHPMIKGGNNRFVRSQHDLPAQMFSDRDKVRQVLLNLLANASKFTEGGMISLTASTRPARDERRGEQVVFQISDTGIGIPPDKLDRLFTPFEQVDPSATRRYGGTGLGLAISMRLCRMLGGTIEVESKLGQGSIFRVKLPITSQDPDA